MHPQPYPTHSHPEPALHLLGGIWIAAAHLRLAADHGPHPAALRAPGRPPALPGLPPGRPLMASAPSAKARTELNVAIGYVDRAARRLAGEPG
jgi:hypothetical protein